MSRRALGASAFTLVTAVGYAACFADLTEPAACPPAAKVAAQACNAQPGSPPCLAPSSFACFGKTDCGCQGAGSACPPSASPCFPAGDCPAAVTGAVDAGVTCYALAGPPSFAESCVGCGCPDCAQECDGVGPAVGAIVPPGAGPVPILAASLPNLPGEGRLGVYLRVRGTSNAIVTAGGLVPGGNSQQVQAITPFTEQVLQDVFDWPKEQAAPGTLVIEAMPGGATLLEVDCIIPFVEGP